MFEQHRPLRTIKPLHHNQVTPNPGPKTGVASSMGSRVVFTSHRKRELEKDGLVPPWPVVADRVEQEGAFVAQPTF